MQQPTSTHTLKHVTTAATLARRVYESRVVAVAAAACVLALVHFSGILNPVHSVFAAFRAEVTQREPSQSAVIVAIDTESLRAAGQWPWSRERFARAIDNLRAAGAAVVAFDVDFSARSEAAADAEFARAIDDAQGTVILPTFVQPSANGLVENIPLSTLSDGAVFSSVNIPIDSDGRVRRYHYGFNVDGAYRSSLAATLTGTHYGDTSSFLLDYGVRASSIDRLSFEDVYNGDFDPTRVQGRAVLIGAVALELGDEFATPVAPAVPGVVLHALAYENIVQGRTLLQLSSLVSYLIAFVALLVLWPRKRSVRRAIALHSLALLAWVGGPILLQAFTPVSWDPATLAAAQMLAIAYSVHIELKQRARQLIEQREQYLQHMALHDPETKLPNRRALVSDVAASLQQDACNIIVVAVFGVDRFSMMRGAIGYSKASEMIRKLAPRIQVLTGADKVYHLSTSIFGVAIEASSPEHIEAVFETLRSSLNIRVNVDGQAIHPKLRVGVATADQSGGRADRLLEQASLALDEARTRNAPFAVFDEAHARESQTQFALVSDITTGVERDEFSLVYQSKVSAASGEITGAEALMRWRHPRLGDVRPDQFISVAEETGAIDALTRWALQRAVEDQRRLRREGYDLRIAVNVSGRCLSDPQFCAFAGELVRNKQARLAFEITETAIINDPTQAMRAIEYFRACGIGVSIDDFGSGYSSLAYLKRLAADELKIDKSLIDELSTNKRDQLILSSTIGLAHSLGLSVVCEGIEDAATMTILRDLGCDVFQGYHISRPVSFDQLRATLQGSEQSADVQSAVC